MSIDDLTASLSNLTTSSEVSTPSLSSDGNLLPPLREYQQRMVERTERIINDIGDDHSTKQPPPSVLIYLPTGGGKTRIAVEIALNEVVNRNGRVLFIVNKDTLTKQAKNSFSMSKPLKVDVLGDKKTFDKKCLEYETKKNSSNVLISTIQMFTSRFMPKQRSSVSNDAKKDKLLQPPSSTSIAGAMNATDNQNSVAETVVSSSSKPSDKKLPPLPKVSLVIIDECHCVHAPTCQALVHAYPSASIFGLTATPFRLNEDEELSSIFSTIVRGPSITQLVEKKVLVPPIVYGEVFPCDQKVAVSEYSLNQSVKLWLKHAKGRPTVAFCVDIKHSKNTAAFMNKHGIKAAHIDGKTSVADREGLIRMLAEREIDMLCSVDVLCEGFDLPIVSCVILLRPTESRGLYIQQVGRGLRSVVKKKPQPSSTNSASDLSVSSKHFNQASSLKDSTVKEAKLKSSEDLESELSILMGQVSIDNEEEGKDVKDKKTVKSSSSQKLHEDAELKGMAKDSSEKDDEKDVVLYDEISGSKHKSLVEDTMQKLVSRRDVSAPFEETKTNCVVLDLVGLTAKFGPIVGPQEYSWESSIMGPIHQESSEWKTALSKRDEVDQNSDKRSEHTSTTLAIYAINKSNPLKPKATRYLCNGSEKEMKTVTEIDDTKKKKSGQVTKMKKVNSVPMATCPNLKCGAFFHRSVDTCLGCGKTVRNNLALRKEKNLNLNMDRVGVSSTTTPKTTISPYTSTGTAVEVSTPMKVLSSTIPKKNRPAIMKKKCELKVSTSNTCSDGSETASKVENLYQTQKDVTTKPRHQKNIQDVRENLVNRID